jgi:hypothetical protein
MRFRITLLAVLATVVAVFVGRADAITGNFQDDFVHDYVGLIVFYTDDDPVSATHDPFSHRCTGTLISPTVMVTAGHCTTGVDFGRVYFQQSTSPGYDDDAFFGFGGDPNTGYPYEGGVTFSEADNFGFDGVSFPDTKDLGVVVLDQPVTPPSGLFGLLPTAGAVTDYIDGDDTQGKDKTSKKDVRFTASGYGLSDTTPAVVSFRERLMASSYLVNDHSANTDGFNIQTTANASQGKGGTCSGDSGGPIFIEGTRVIAAVNSFGFNARCRGVDFSYRLDRAPVLSWINDPARSDAG